VHGFENRSPPSAETSDQFRMQTKAFSHRFLKRVLRQKDLRATKFNLRHKNP
jgi:hypothetical protein